MTLGVLYPPYSFYCSFGEPSVQAAVFASKYVLCLSTRYGTFDDLINYARELATQLRPRKMARAEEVRVCDSLE